MGTRSLVLKIALASGNRINAGRSRRLGGGAKPFGLLVRSRIRGGSSAYLPPLAWNPEARPGAPGERRTQWLFGPFEGSCAAPPGAPCVEADEPPPAPFELALPGDPASPGVAGGPPPFPLPPALPY
jgi:hypothetical protein